MTEPAWLPDPTGRHEHRWFDGTSFTDRVADGGVAGIDPGHVADPPPAAPVAPVWTPGTWSPTTPAAAPLPIPSPGAEPAGGFRRRVPIVLAVGGVVLLGAGAAFLLLSGEDPDTGTFEGRIDGDSPVGVHTVELAAGEALTIDLAPDSTVDAVLGILVDDDTADLLEDAYGDAVALDRRSLTDVFGVDAEEIGVDADQVLLRTDLGFPGEEEQLVLGAPEDMEVHVVVGPFEEDDDIGGYEITLETFDLGLEAGADGDELLQAIGDLDEIPGDFKQVAEDLLATGSG